MLTETPLTLLAAPDRDHLPAVGLATERRDLSRVEDTAAQEARAARIERALGAVEALGRRRRAQELVEAIERLGAGLGTTMVALDDAVAAVVDAHEQAPRVPAEAPGAVDHAPEPAAPRAFQGPAWTPISTPIAPITVVVPPAPAVAAAPAPVVAAAPPVVAAAPAPVVAAAPVPAAPAVRPHVPSATAAAAADAAPPRPRRQAPAGLAAFVIDFSAITG